MIMCAAASIDDSRRESSFLQIITQLRGDGKTGKLNAQFRSQAGAFYFLGGRLVAAELGTLKGFSAINVALWMEGGRFAFEPNVTAAAEDPDITNAELLLGRLLNIDQVENLETTDAAIAEESNTSDEAVVAVSWPLEQKIVTEAPAEVTVSPTATQEEAPESESLRLAEGVPDHLPDSVNEISHPVFVSEKIANESISDKPEEQLVDIRSRLRTFDMLQRYRRLIAPTAVALLLATVILAVANIRHNPNVQVSPAAHLQSQVIQPSQLEASTENVSTHLNTVSATGNDATGSSARQVESPAPTQHQLAKLKDVLPTAEKQTLAQPVVEPSKTTATPSPQRTTASNDFVEIPIELRIENGRVTEAHVGRRQSGAEAFEATALHLARQRRYPPGTSASETVVLRIASQPGSKEP